MSEKRHFHPLAIVISLFESIKSMFFIFLIIIFRSGLDHWYGWGACGGLLLILLGFALVRYFFEYYEISPEKVVIYKGIFRKSETDIPYERIQTIKQRQWFFFQPFQVTQVLIETAGGSSEKAEASLPAVSEEVLQLIENFRRREQLTATDTCLEPLTETINDLEDSREEELTVGLSAETSSSTSELPLKSIGNPSKAPEYIYTITNQQIFLFGITDISILAAAFALLAFAQEFIPEEWLDKAADASVNLIQAGWIIALALTLVVLLVIIVISLVKNFMQYYNFKVSRNGNTLTIESGLLERRVQKIPLEKLQGIRIKQQLLRRILRLSSVELILAGGQEKEGESGSKDLYFLPIVSDRELYRVLDFLLPEWDFDEPQIRFVSRGKLWYFWRWLLLIGSIGSIAGFLIHPIAGGIWTLLILLVLLGRALDCRFQGYQIQSAHRICFQNFAFITKTLTFVERPKIQAFTEKSSIWLYKKQIGHVVIDVKEGTADLSLSLQFIDYPAVTDIKQFFKQKSSIG